MFPKYRPPLNPLSSYGGDIAMAESRFEVCSKKYLRALHLSHVSIELPMFSFENSVSCHILDRCYVPSALRVYRTIDLVKASADPSNYPLEQRNICPYPEMQLFYKLLSASESKFFVLMHNYSIINRHCLSRSISP